MFSLTRPTTLLVSQIMTTGCSKKRHRSSGHQDLIIQTLVKRGQLSYMHHSQRYIAKVHNTNQMGERDGVKTETGSCVPHLDFVHCRSRLLWVATFDRIHRLSEIGGQNEVHLWKM
jgi:hypothetical protein